MVHIVMNLQFFSLKFYLEGHTFTITLQNETIIEL